MRKIKGGLVFMKNSSYDVIKNTPWNEVRQENLSITQKSSEREQKYLLFLPGLWGLLQTDKVIRSSDRAHKFFLLLTLLWHSIPAFYPHVDRVLDILLCFEKITTFFST